jgi:hypothetical protein
MYVCMYKLPAAQSQLPHLPPFSLAQVPAAQSQLPHFPVSLAIAASSNYEAPEKIIANRGLSCTLFKTHTTKYTTIRQDQT